jgi:5'(3')-deoxyribonucleotidase
LGEKYLGDAAYKRLILSHHKDLLRGDYLIDDSTKNGVADFQGKHIHFGTPEFPNWQTVIEYFQQLIEK